MDGDPQVEDLSDEEREPEPGAAELPEVTCWGGIALPAVGVSG